MSTFDGEDTRREIIIVKRGNNEHEDGHHGGVWKIAFADFMTAMMCFFLVMWLINAADEQTKASIASYFNPITLVTQDPSGQGVDDPGQSPQTRDGSASEADKAAEAPANTMHEKSGPGQFANSADQSDTKQTSDAHLFADPYAVLAEIAAETGTLQNISSKGDGGAQTSGPATGADGGESYRDPFAPDFWSKEVADPDAAEMDVFRQAPEEQQPPAEEMAALDEAASETEATSPAAPEAEPAASPVEPAISQETEKLAEQIRQEIDDAFGRNAALNETISVTPQADGVLISLTDELNYGMFEIGSAVPQRELVLAMEKISHTLNEHGGKLRINGHTDGRPFQGEEYDNWRLSTARAHAAYYMLVRGGMDETRVREVAGFADRELKIANDPLANANRRIEIFLETGG